MDTHFASTPGRTLAEETARGLSHPVAALWNHRNEMIAGLCLAAILAHLVLRFGHRAGEPGSAVPLLLMLCLGGVPLLYDLLRATWHGEFGSDLLAGISIITSVILGEYLAGAIVVLMLAGGQTLESYAVSSASSVLRALARRMPSSAHRKSATGVVEVALDEIAVGETLVIYPHETCPADGVVVAGHGMMDESFLTGEPFQMDKAPGSAVISGAINGESALTIQAVRRPVDSRYAKIMEVMRESEQKRPRLRRLGDQLGAIYTPFALGLALLAWAWSGEAVRFLAVLVVATPCPLLLGIPVAIIGSISLAAKRAIIVKNPVALEQVGKCRTAIFDKTGTLTYGEAKLTEQRVAVGGEEEKILALAASLERYSKHPLARAILAAAEQKHLPFAEADQVSESSVLGLSGVVEGHQVQITSRQKLAGQPIPGLEHMPAASGGLECQVLIDGHYAATYRFRDAPRVEGSSFVRHLQPKHDFRRMMIVSGDREAEVRYLAEEVGIGEVSAEKSPEEKLSIVRAETARDRTLYVGDGINDAPAMMAATVGMALGRNSDVTAEAASVVVMENSLKKVDEFLHISHRMRRIALQSAVGGMVLSAAGMVVAAMGILTPVAGAITQEVIDVLAVANALRAGLPPRVLSDL